MSQELIEVAVDAPIRNPLTYKWDAQECGLPARGQSVRVPLGRGKRQVAAVVLGRGTDSGEYKLKSAFNVDETRPPIPAKYMKWLEWMAGYYLHPVGQVTSLAFPPLKRIEKPRKSKKSPPVPIVEQDSSPKLTDEQNNCLSGIEAQPGFGVHLVHGVTGSGKTEVYLNFLKKIIESDKRALVLVPEISLTPQLLKRFASRFPDQVAVIHSHLTDREKSNQWYDVYDGKKKILIGARSALFCPIDNLGAIVIDEEHEPSFKQEEKLKYHARDAAVVLAKEFDCPIILGSATPSMESWRNIREDRYFYHEMKCRVSDRKMPEMTVIDMRAERGERKEEASILYDGVELPFWMSRKLFDHLKETLKNEKQAALFLNRRGVAQTVLCENCGYVYECPNCEISLTLHDKSHLVCHYCDYSEPMKEKCKSCDEPGVKPLGIGTERVQKDIQLLFPEAFVARADRDEINSREDLEDLIEDMETGKIDVLVGTQMIAKGLDFPKLTLVGLVMADVGFNMPDFRSTERGYQLLTQVSGRAGRHSVESGQVVIQTYNPEHPSITFAQQNNFASFADWELANRKDLRYPPYARLAAIRLQSLNHNKVQETCNLLEFRAEKLKEVGGHYDGIMPLGPSQSPLARLRNKYRYHMLIKSPTAQVLSAFCIQLMGDQSWISSGTKVQIDIDPINML